MTKWSWRRFTRHPRDLWESKLGCRFCNSFVEFNSSPGVVCATQLTVYSNDRCGIRGAYMELVNLDSQVMAMLKKMLSAKLCPTTAGQVLVTNDE